MDRPSDLIQSVSRAFRILEVVGTADHGLSPKAVARRCRLSLSTTYHLMRTLSYEGYLHRLDNGDYALGLKIADRFRDLMTTLTGPFPVDAVLRDLAKETSQSAYLARFVEGRVVITEVVEAPQSPRLEDLIPGFDDAAHATALGKALLSTQSVTERAAYVRETGLRRFTPQTVVDLEALEVEIAGAHDGVYTEVAQYRDGVACAALLVATGRSDDPWWAVGVSASASRLLRRRDEIVNRLRIAAEALAA